MGTLAGCVTGKLHDALWDFDGDGVQVPYDCDDDDPDRALDCSDDTGGPGPDTDDTSASGEGEGETDDSGGATLPEPAVTWLGALYSAVGARVVGLDLETEAGGPVFGVGAPYWEEVGAEGKGAVIVMWAVDLDDAQVNVASPSANLSRYYMDIDRGGVNVGGDFGLAGAGAEATLVLGAPHPTGQSADSAGGIYLQPQPGEDDGTQVPLSESATFVEGEPGDVNFGLTVAGASTGSALVGSYDADAWLLPRVSPIMDDTSVTALEAAGEASRLDEEAGVMRATAAVSGTDASGQSFYALGAFEADGEALANEGTIYLILEDEVTGGETYALGDSTRLYGGVGYANAGQALALGDLDGDGALDLAVGAGYESGSTRAWVIYDVESLLDGGVYGAASDVSDSTDSVLTVTGTAGADMVVDVALTAPTGGGSPADLLISLHGYDPIDYPGAGSVLLIDGAPEGTMDLADPDVLLLAQDDLSQVGSSIAAPGDLDGDGTCDLLVGASYYGERSEDLGRGAAFLYLGGAF